MPVSDLDIHRSAYQWMQLHGDEAIAKAREMVESMRAKGDEEGADVGEPADASAALGGVAMAGLKPRNQPGALEDKEEVGSQQTAASGQSPPQVESQRCYGRYLFAAGRNRGPSQGSRPSCARSAQA